MNETEFKEKWKLEKPIYEAWGEYVMDTITQALKDKGKNLDIFLKVPAKYRLKDDNSLIDKAFYRPDKNYTDPYNQVEDKVGVRFIVLLVTDIDEIYNIIKSRQEWDYETCKHFEEDKEKEPLLFTYQSIHCILRPLEGIVYKEILIPKEIPCEVQIRTLLQHAHAELTHDAIYKSKKAIQPKVHRTVAKSMALIETTDDFFKSVTELLNYGPLEQYRILERLNSLYFCNTNIKSHTQKSSVIIWDVFEQFINENLITEVEEMLRKNDYLYEIIQKKYSECSLYQQSTVLFVYWMLKLHKRRLIKDWPLSTKIIDLLANDLGINTSDD